MDHFLLLCDDLLDSSRIAGVLQQLGKNVDVAKKPEQVAGLLQQSPTSTVLVDLDHAGLSIDSFVAELRTLVNDVNVIGFGSHVDVAKLRAARQAGCDQVMPRSQFFGDWLAAFANVSDG
jgi:DNA-binding NarL/FixJ family response regulator